MLDKTTRIVFGIVGALIAAILLVAGIVILQQLSRPASPAPSVALFEPASENSGITYINPPRPMPDFSLTDHNGDAIRLSDLRGKPTLIAWGFTNCPDICPLTLSDFRSMHQALDATNAHTVNFVFISVDGARDTPEALSSLFRRLRVDDFMFGMTGSHEEVLKVGADYGVQAKLNEPNAMGFYTVDHTGGSFLLDAEGNWVARYAFAADRSAIVADIRRLLSLGT